MLLRSNLVVEYTLESGAMTKSWNSHSDLLSHHICLSGMPYHFGPGPCTKLRDFGRPIRSLDECLHARMLPRFFAPGQNSDVQHAQNADVHKQTIVTEQISSRQRLMREKLSSSSVSFDFCNQDAEVANMYKMNRETYNQTARFWTETYAQVSGSLVCGWFTKGANEQAPGGFVQSRAF